MTYKKPVQKFSGKIKEITLGENLKLGGESVLPFYSFDGDTGNKPAIGLEIWDVYPEDWPTTIMEELGDKAKKPAEWAKFCEEKYKPDFICLRFVGANQDMGDRTPEECAQIAKEVAEAVKLPLVIAGCDSNEKNGKIFTKVAEALADKNYAFLSAVEANYKEVGAAVGLAYGNIVVAESSVDLNLAKQLNILLTQLGVKWEKMLMNPGTSAVGYGFEYVITTMDRIRLAALDQNDTTLQLPMVMPISFDTWKVKESVATEQDAPEWGDREERGIAMEISTAVGVLAAGANAVVLRHPRSLEVVREFINNLI
ncbi:acetyl-CoA decarbonylase/synthase complex subunit delta [Thermosediminibacter oceani]|uniref:CO dehydrogenase/acetyl-CoA synthase delta subunit, TIM barrel n=1 Tax=Thermosediminibacter oceani (strain ATCC BAA-1034 / DSM 16646 / JW/IW-1228P) TaxID=555079 RepID=D9S2E6_THEOJ|nr:acetyl-CoA decarbonylase/synthase complex subunit delta [Thermosediminibacter oceani]ADL07573.1 CO dehydrogenase/acetyl-CoA synthase delta subunit, TIM barrel [Thermosediminibacter oceani DSM 16646]